MTVSPYTRGGGRRSGQRARPWHERDPDSRRRADAHVRTRIRRAAAWQVLSTIVTVTVRDGSISVRRLWSLWSGWMRSRHNPLRGDPWIGVAEYQARGAPHLHVLTSTRWRPWRAIQASWRKYCVDHHGGDKSDYGLNITPPKTAGARHAIKYLSKYVSKSIAVDDDGKPMRRLRGSTHLLPAPRRLLTAASPGSDYVGGWRGSIDRWVSRGLIRRQWTKWSVDVTAIEVDRDGVTHTLWRVERRDEPPRGPPSVFYRNTTIDITAGGLLRDGHVNASVA